MRTVYLNVKHAGKVETVDQLSRADFSSSKELYAEIRRLKNEYRTASGYYSGIYSSQRCTNDWRGA